jgi:HTH-type transcriptional regulator / antitoxin HipB
MKSSPYATSVRAFFFALLLQYVQHSIAAAFLIRIFDFYSQKEYIDNIPLRDIMNQVITNTPQLSLLLQSARKTRGLTQVQAAERLGLTQSRISKLEQEPQAMTIQQLLSLCSVLGLELSMRPKPTEVTTRKGSSIEQGW